VQLDGAFLFGLGWAAVTALNGLAWKSDRPRYVDAFGISAMLFLSWFICTASLALYGIPDGMRLYPLWDGICAVVVAWAWQTDRRRWKAVMLGTFVGIFALHCAVWARYLNGSANAMLYLKLLDVAALAQMSVAAWPGGRHVAVSLRDWLLRGGSSGHRVGG